QAARRTHRAHVRESNDRTGLLGDRMGYRAGHAEERSGRDRPSRTDHQEVRWQERQGRDVRGVLHRDPHARRRNPLERKLKVTQKILQINFKFTSSADEYKKLVAPFADPIAAVPGLEWKVWLVSEKNH